MEPSDDAASSSGSFKANSVSSANSSSSNSQSVNAGAPPSPTCSCGHRATSSAAAGAASAAAAGSSGDPITVTVAPTTGGQFELKVGRQETIDFVKKTISKRLKVPKERICLLWKDRHLREGTLSENGVCDGSRLTLLPSIETGLLTQRPEQSVMQALESLNDIQVNDFLSGKAPLNLTMRLGDHMMLIQLQLSAVAPVGSAHRRSSTAHGASSSSSSSSLSSTHPSLPAAAASSASQTPSGGSGSSHPWAGSSTLTTPVLLPGAGLSAMLNAPLTPAAPPLLAAAELNNAAAAAAAAVPQKAEGGCASMECVGCDVCDNRPLLDTRALAEASRNLTQTLKQLSAEVLTSRSANEANGRRRNRHGAIIESMQHHGKGVYSGTFSGTLNPALQDKQGRPKRDISTIIHILNDLLCATPQYRRAAAGVTPTTSAAAAAGSSTAATSARPSSEQHDDAAAAAAAHQRKSTGKAGLPTLLLLREESRRYAEENQAIRGKLEQLRMVMEERRARRRARREARVAPYNTWSPKSDSAAVLAAASCSAAAAAAAAGSLNCDAAADSSMDASDSSNSADLCQLNTEPVVA